MNTMSVIISLALVISFVLLIWFSNYKRNKKIKTRIEMCKRIAAEKGFLLSEIENIKDVVLGLDRQKNVLFYLNLFNNIDVAVDLNNMKMCKKKDICRNIDIKGVNEKITDRVEIAFYSNDINIPKVSVEIFNSENDSYHLHGELQFSDKWVVIINNHINELRKPK